MAYSEILLEVADGVALVTLNRPERLNAYTPTMGRELSEAFAACDADDAVRAIIVTGAGRAFCAGADLARGGETFDRTAAAEYQGMPPERPWEGPARETAPVSVAIAKWLLWGMASETDLARADDLDARAFWWSGTQPDAREGVRAFLEKRPPRWSMRPSRDLPDFLSPPSRGR